MRGYIFDHNRPSANFTVIAYGDRAQDFGTGANHNMVAKGGVSFDIFPRCTAQGNLVVEDAVISDHSGFADNGAATMVDEKAFPNPGARVDINTGQKKRKMVDPTR
jgi:hypothetical protein